MASAANKEVIQQFYIAYYGRPGDPAGVDYWADRLEAAGGVLTAILDAFGNSTEADAQFGAGRDNATRAQIESSITDIYQQTFGRAPDAAGLDFYADGVEAGTFTLIDVAKRIVDGRTGDDVTILANKTTAATAYTDALRANATDSANYSGDAAGDVGRNWLATVDETAASLTDAQADLADTIDSLAPVAFTLTTSVESVTGGPVDDSFTAVTSALSSARTLNSGDVIDGGAATDTLTVSMNADFGGFTVGTGGGKMTGVENLVLNNLAETARTFDATGVTGLKTITIDANAENFTVSNIAAAGSTGLAVDLANPGDSLTLSFGTAVTGATATSDKLTLTVADAEALDVTAAGIETLVVVSNGDANVLDLSLGGTKTLTVSGAADLDITDQDTTTLTSIDTSAATGDISATIASSTKLASVTGGAGVDVLSLGSSVLASVNTGAGADSLTVTGMKSNTALAGGTGTDILTLSKLSGTYAPTISGFETLRLVDSAATSTLTLSATNISDVTTISVRDDQSGNVTIAGLPNSSIAIKFEDASSTAASYGTNGNTLTYTGAAAVTLSVTSVQTSAAETIATNLTAGNATSLTATVGAYAAATGSYTVANATSVALTVNENGSYATGTLSAANATSATVTANGTFNTRMDVDKATSLKINVGANGGLGTSADFNAAKATTVTIVSDDTDGFALDLNAPEATTVTIDSDGPVTVDSTTDLSKVQTLTLKGAATSVTLNTAGMVGDKSSSVTVDASDLEGSLTLNVGDYSAGDGSVEVIGSDLSANTITIAGGRNEANITGGIANDSVTFGEVFSGEGIFSFDLGTVSTGDTVTFVTASDLTDSEVTFSGVDTISFTTAGALTGSSISGQTLTLTGAQITIEGGASADTIDLSNITATTLSVDGAAGADVITGTATAETINGGAGNDSISAGSGNDIIIGGSGADTMTGGAGDDVFRISGVGETTLSGVTSGTAITSGATITTTSADVLTDYGTGGGTDKVSFDPAVMTNTLTYSAAATPGNNTVLTIKGTYNSATKVFTYNASVSATDPERASLVIYDANPGTATADVALKGIVLVGFLDDGTEDTSGTYTGLSGTGG